MDRALAEDRQQNPGLDLRGGNVALFGRFSRGARERLAAQVVGRGGSTARDLTRRSRVLVVGALATPLIDTGALRSRLASAHARTVPVLAERAFVEALAGAERRSPATVPVAAALSGARLSIADLEVLAAFDLITLAGEHCAFADAAVLRAAEELLTAGRSLGEVVPILGQARDLAPRGRHRIVLTGAGRAALQWEGGLTTLEGQGLLPLPEGGATLEDLYEAAALAEDRAEHDEAARLYDLLARADRTDPIAFYNLGNIRLIQGNAGEAELAYRRALARDPDFAEARYNLSQALEASGDAAGAESELAGVVRADPGYADAVFNLAQLKLKKGEAGAARALFQRYLALDPPADWAVLARKGLMVCAAGAPA
ncbi:MAG TPA: tetratricopeptide repeat protein [Caulobacteraceae bacterium]|nr:tetratricopeptide repeat protein [Caulobacteraceae bacterium]